ncbi:hypothetical protein FIV50_15600 [Microbacterium foliorum]|uniref:Uncharacterized protein n=1 Tax=Microbacterium foliorum TaxID=104336 RepID=A0A4Y5YUI8_9MICO|nr:hypothetical protein FIV50_15600 [Microbacterium foliorum]
MRGQKSIRNRRFRCVFDPAARRPPGPRTLPRAEPSRAEPSRAEPSRARPTRQRLSQFRSERVTHGSTQ